MRLAALAFACFLGLSGAVHAEEGIAIPAPAYDPANPAQSEKAVLAGGCFWGVQAVFQHVKGVIKVVSGYSGGSRMDADYRTVSSGSTGHAESVEITFDPKIISYARILQIYFSVAHDPTQINRQGPDRGTQYRTNIFFASPEQKKIADAYIAQLNKAKRFEKPIATRVDPLRGFYAAEDYHQDYLTLHPDQPYIMLYDLPKLGNLKRLFPSLWRDKPVLVKA